MANTIRDRILAHLRLNPDGVDDDELALALELRARQQANSRCRQLATLGLIERRPVNGKIRNFATSTSVPPPPPPPPPVGGPISSAYHSLWFWEGNVQSAVVRFLVARGYAIDRVADTASKEPGIDIVARKDGRRLLVSVKGYPRGTDRTNASTQARHWYKQAIFDVIAWRSDATGDALAVALPDFITYWSLDSKTTWLAQQAPFATIYVSESGDCTVNGTL